MAFERLISVLNEHDVPHDKFNHFDYVDAFEQLSELELSNHPKKRRLVEQFASRCLQKIEQQEKSVKNKARVNNFLERTRQHEEMRQEKIEAMRFLQQKYDQKSKQLMFYPKINKKLATQRNRHWKDLDGFDNVSQEQAIKMPNQFAVDNRDFMSFKPH